MRVHFIRVIIVKEKFTVKTHLHRPYVFTVYLVSRVSDKVLKPICSKTNSEEDLEKVPEWLFTELSKVSNFITQKFNSRDQIPMILTKKKRT